MNAFSALFLLAIVVTLNASTGALRQDIDEDAVDRLLEEVELLSARTVREASSAPRKAAKKASDKKNAKAKNQGCGQTARQENPVAVKTGGKHKAAKIPSDEKCQNPNLGHAYEVISVDTGASDDVVEEEPEHEVATKPSVNQTAVFLNIIKDLKTLKNATGRGTKGNSTNDLPSHLNGVWLSETAGLRFSLQEQPVPTTTTQIPNNHEHTTAHAPRPELHVSVTDRHVQPREKLLSTDWQFTATAPVALGSPFYMVAMLPAEKRIAVFIGQAKVCSQKEIIYGGWIFGRVQPSSSCQEVELGVWTRNEVMRRGHPASCPGAGVGAKNKAGVGAAECSKTPQ